MPALTVYDVQALYEPLCAQYGVDLALMLAMCQRESGYRPEVVGTSGELGMAQLTRSAWITVWNAKADFAKEALDLRLNAESHIRYYLWGRGLVQSNGQLRDEWYIAAYNCGVGRTWASKSFRDLPIETQFYVADVMTYWREHTVRLFAEATMLQFAERRETWLR